MLAKAAEITSRAEAILFLVVFGSAGIVVPVTLTLAVCYAVHARLFAH